MGSTVSSNSNISRVDVYKSPSGQEQTVVYSTTDSRTCTLRVNAGADSASVTLRDYTFDREGTRVDIRVRDVETNEGGVDVGAVDCTHWGSALAVRKDGKDGKFCMAYGVANVRCGYLVVTKHETSTHGSALFVQHIYGPSEQIFSAAVVEVWYDAGKATCMCNITGPFRRYSFLEALLAMRQAYAHAVNIDDPLFTGQQSITTRLINNSGGPFHGHLNGSIIGDSMINLFNVFMNNK